ncbi:MAG: hypothetical protein A3G93_00840 [Nitrospinae bacterium RIFCSPLOWO2_12_FULL_45_22]|nr:MAG: hypothetical protein A3G93_00840 [Nitrospinae bacterium RIFCSPLOWO2_12_FULL_45_22]
MDTYSKIILTLIAVALWGLLLKPIVTSERLQASDIQDVNIVQIDGARVPYATPISVKNIQ